MSEIYFTNLFSSIGVSSPSHSRCGLFGRNGTRNNSNKFIFAYCDDEHLPDKKTKEAFVNVEWGFTSTIPLLMFVYIC